MARFPRSSVIFHVVCSVGRLVPILGAIALATSIVAAAGKLPAVDGDALLQHIKVLASDEFEGRAPGSRGEDRTVAYLQEQFRKMGLAPGNTDGTFIQQVPMVGITPSQDSHLTLRKGNETKVLTYRDDVVAWTKHVVDRVSVDDSELVFVGYGVQAPEFNGDDYKGVDVKGKTLVMLINDPAVPDPRDPSRLDPKIFGGKAMTYYGRWTYKYEIGASLGAAAVLIVHETGPAAYPFSVVQNNANERFDLAAPDKNLGRSKVEGWITREAAVALCAMAGQDFEALKKAAITREFRPVPLGVTASIAITTKIRPVDSQNVIAKVEGSDPRLKDEYVIYTAHWDHLGIGEPVNGDRIYNGALDNASGTATMLEIARAFTKLQPAPKRSVLFLAVTAEEQGLLGAEYYATHPIYPLTRTVANINMDGANMFGRTRDITIVGLGASDLDDYLRQAAEERGRTISPDPEPEKGYYYRSDHFNFAKAGVPALYPDQGDDYVGKPAGYGKMVRERYTTEDYHRPSDEVKPYWEVAGAVDDAELLLDVGSRVADAATRPEWKPGNEFRRIREESLRNSQSK
jgi:Zn-dependent M28 family amino/carboxypeptidase